MGAKLNEPEKTIDEINKDLQDMRAEELDETREDDDASE